MTDPAVEVEGLVVRYGPTTAVDGVSFTARSGQVLALLGPNGAGKTTTVKTCGGVWRPEAGRVRVLGLEPVANHRQLVRKIGIMPQRGGVYPGIRVAEVMRLFASYYEHPVPAAELLDRMGLAGLARSTWRTLSGGEQQRLSLALAILGRPEVVFLDEPTAGIDPAGRQVVRAVVAELRSSGVAVVMSTHELVEAERLADQVVIIDRGRVVASGSPVELMADGAGEEIRFAGPPRLDTASLGSSLSCPVVETTPGEYRVVTAATPAAVAALTAWLATHDLPLADLRAGRQSLEDVFLRLTGR